MEHVVAEACRRMGLDGGDAVFVQHSANAALADPLISLHAADLAGIESWNPAATIRALLTSVSTADSTWARARLGLEMPELVGRLLARCAEIERGLATVTWTLPFGVVHGDAHPGNLLRTAQGRVVLCDLDTVASGPREADLVPVAHGATRFHRERTDYDRFAERYGFDVLDAPSWPVLRRLRDLQLATYLLPRLPADPGV